jgi:hypothetical protein
MVLIGGSLSHIMPLVTYSSTNVDRFDVAKQMWTINRHQASVAVANLNLLYSSLFRQLTGQIELQKNEINKNKK